MSRSHLRVLSSACARAIRRAKASGGRAGSCHGVTRNGASARSFRVPTSHFRVDNTAPATVRNSRRCIASPSPACGLYYPPSRAVGRRRIPMNFEARIEPLGGRLPKVSYHWDPETDILSVACKGGAKSNGLNGTVDLEGADGSFVVIDVVGGTLQGVDVVSWPDDVRTVADLATPAVAKDGRVVFPSRLSQPGVAAVEVETALTVEKNPAESVFHLRVGRSRAATVV